MPQKTTEFVVGIGTLALINAGLAQSKNRSGLGWFLASLLLGPIATLLLVLLNKKEPPSELGEKKTFNLQDFRKQ